VELSADPQLAAARPGVDYTNCTLQNVQRAAAAWRDSAAADRDGMTWFYFAGHGIQRTKNDAVLLLEDFGQPFGGALQHAIDLQTLFNGMAPSPAFPDIARTQLYFIDACRIRPEEFKTVETQTPSQVFQVALSGEDDRRAPIFFATMSGAVANGLRGKPSIFNSILLQCLDGAAGKLVDDHTGSSWKVTTYSAIAAMKALFDEWKSAGLDQTFTVSGLVQEDVPLCKLGGPPHVDLLIDINPELARYLSTIRITDAASGAQVALPADPPGPPYALRCPAGTYRFDVAVPPNTSYITPPPLVRTVLPPRHQFIGKVVP
jgi:hypothetical protein